jgi:tRNA (guanine37-N1)-methyltransferase
MRFDIMTLFPEMVSSVLGESIIGRAQSAGHISVNTYNIRDYSEDKHRRVDDTPYGGGKGMLMAAPPIYNCYSAVKEKIATEEGTDFRTKVIYMSPKGQVLTQDHAKELLEYDGLIILCGHYEGIDERVKTLVTDEISIGDFVLTGGEIPAAAIVDSVVRLLPGVLGGGSEATAKESFGSDGLLEAPQYTRPPEYRGLKVPDVLIGGDHAKTESWRKRQAFDLTSRNRPDIIAMGGTYAV